jgi:hypothetical protein
MTRYIVQSGVSIPGLHDDDERRRRGERIEQHLRAAGVKARWVECRTGWLWSGVLDVIEAVDDRAARAAADVIALAHAPIDRAR